MKTTKFPELPESFLLQRLSIDRQGPPAAIIDTDAANEIDDQFAIAWALLSGDEIDLRAIHIAPYHNARSSSCADGQRRSFAEAHRVLNALDGPRAPIMAGAEAFLPALDTPVETDAARDLVARAMAHPVDGPPLYVATIGCLTNLASALLMEPRIIERIVVLMQGGHDFEWPSAGEFNFNQDILAARVVVDSGVPLFHFPATRTARTLGLSYAEVQAHVRGCGPIGDLLADLYEKQSDLTPGYRRTIWDLAPVGWLINPKMTPSTVRACPVLTPDGLWSPNLFGRPIRQVFHLDTSAIYIDFFRKLATCG